MDQKAIKEAYGEKLTFMCGLDTQTFLISASPKEVYSQMVEKARILSEGGGYIGAVSHTIQHDIPVENIMALIQALDDFKPSSLN
jgi:uroporphyrinogen decarboxylase